MNAADWFRKNLKGRVHQHTQRLRRHPRVYRVVKGALERLSRPKDARPKDLSGADRPRATPGG